MHIQLLHTSASLAINENWDPDVRDDMEMMLRELSAYAHLKRTGDVHSATQILALKPPGTNPDVAPGWLVSEATAFSRVEHQRTEWVKKDRKGKGKPDKPDKDPKGLRKGDRASKGDRKGKEKPDGGGG